jgi:hypothetical protein
LFHTAEQRLDRKRVAPDLRRNGGNKKWFSGIAPDFVVWLSLDPKELHLFDAAAGYQWL